MSFKTTVNCVSEIYWYMVLFSHRLFWLKNWRFSTKSCKRFIVSWKWHCFTYCYKYNHETWEIFFKEIFLQFCLYSWNFLVVEIGLLLLFLLLFLLLLRTSSLLLLLINAILLANVICNQCVCLKTAFERKNQALSQINDSNKINQSCLKKSEIR